MKETMQYINFFIGYNLMRIKYRTLVRRTANPFVPHTFKEFKKLYSDINI